MKKLCLAVMVIFLLVGCTANIRMTDINFESQGDMLVDGSGATNTTDTGQLASADMQAIMDAIMATVKKNKVGILDTIKDAISGEDKTDSDSGAAVSPAEPIVEEVD